MQKLEDEPAIEFHNIHRGFDGLREDDFNETIFKLGVVARPATPSLMPACDRSPQLAG